jgi:site-specific DNA-cytosine methylase
MNSIDSIFFSYSIDFIVYVQDSTGTPALEFAYRWCEMMSQSRYGMPDVIVLENPPGIKTVREDGSLRYMLEGMYARFRKMGAKTIDHREVHCASFGNGTDRVRITVWVGRRP